MTAEEFQEFRDRLIYHNRGEGVNDHCTANPIFIVQSCRIVTGIDLDYDPLYYWTDGDYEGEYNDEEVVVAIKEYIENGGVIKDFPDEPDADDIADHLWRQYTLVNEDYETIFQKIGYSENWEYVTAHFTKEAAEAFIKRKKHDHRKLRIYVDSQYYCHEFNAIIDAIIEGKLKLVED